MNVSSRLAALVVHGLVLEITEEDVEIVAVVERAHAGRVRAGRRAAKRKGGRPPIGTEAARWIDSAPRQWASDSLSICFCIFERLKEPAVALGG